MKLEDKLRLVEEIKELLTITSCTLEQATEKILRRTNTNPKTFLTKRELELILNEYLFECSYCHLWFLLNQKHIENDLQVGICIYCTEE
jgi:hypothetical protein